MKYSMIVNPNAGKKKGMEVAENAAEKLRSRGIEIDILVSSNPGEAIFLAETLNLEKTDGILAIGGDGTLFEVINGLLKNRDSLPVPLGQIPVGTGNSFIKDLGISTVDDALDRIISGKTKSIDLGNFSYPEGSHYFVNLLGTGFVSNVAYRAKRYKALGALSYIFGVLEEVAVLKSTKIEIEIDGTLYKREAIFTEICNSRYTGGDMMMAPGAVIDDGLLDIIILNKVSRLKLLSLFPSIFSGRHIEDPVIEVFQGKKITLKADIPLALTPDGETFGTTPIEAELLTDRMRMFC